jgi:hypothetical protein
MDKRGVEELGPHISLQTLMYAVLSIAVLVLLIYIFVNLVK